MNERSALASMGYVRLLALVSVLAFAAPASAQRFFDVTDWQAVLDGYATEDGGFRYEALHRNAVHRETLASFLQSIATVDLANGSRQAQLAFYIDAYNAHVIASVLPRWPTASVMRISGFFDQETHHIAGRHVTLNAIETEIRRRFADPRIHFVLNCASASCPPLSRQAYSGPGLEERLESATRAFIRRTTRVRGDSIEISRLFEWYATDFTGGVRAFVAARLDASDAAAVRDERRRIVYSEYDWAINARR
jgi:hypothetical protein